MTSPSQDRLYGANSSMAVKVPCRVATTADITLSGLQTIDGVALAANDRVLVKNQTDGTENGIYYADTSTWQRSPDFDGARDVCQGTLVYVNEGSAGLGFWYVTTSGTITPGTTSIVFAQASSTLAVVSVYMQTVLVAATAAAARALLGAVGLTGDETIADIKTFTSAPVLPAGMLTGALHGMTISNNVTDPTNDMDIASGVCRNSTDTVMMVLGASITKRLDAAWAVGTNQGGLDTGAIANDTYHIHVIRRPDTGVVDVLFSTSPTAPTLPANYTQFRRIGSFMRVGGSIIRAVQNGDRFMYTGGGTLDVNATNPGTAAVTRTLSVPTDIVLEAIVSVTLDAITSSGASWLLTSLDQDDVAESATNRTIGIGDAAGDDVQVTGMAQVKTNTSAQIRSRTAVSGASDAFRLSTLGYIDNRGRT